MTKPTQLIDPTQPACAVIETFEDGTAKRNDGFILQSIETNPWFGILTLYGLDKVGSLSEQKSRSAWNRWICTPLTEAERARIAEVSNISLE